MATYSPTHVHIFEGAGPPHVCQVCRTDVHCVPRPVPRAQITTRNGRDAHALAMETSVRPVWVSTCLTL